MDNNQQLPSLPPLPAIEENPHAPTPGVPVEQKPALEFKTPPPPPPPIAVRSLQSDVRSLEQSGGVVPRADIVKLEELEGPGEIAQAAQSVAESVPAPTGVGEIVKNIIVTIVIIIALGAAGYYVYPVIFDNTEAPIVETPPAQPNPPALTHRSLFAKLPTFAATVTISGGLTGQSILAALREEAGNSNVVNTTKELAFRDANGPMQWSSFISALLPGFAVGDIANVIEEDFTGLLLYNEKGAWPSYVAKLKSAVVIADAQAAFASLEGVDVRALYLDDPGIAQDFQTGPFKGSPIRYSIMEKPGASLNYGVVGDYFVIATSFDAFKAAVDLLGL